MHYISTYGKYNKDKFPALFFTFIDCLTSLHKKIMHPQFRLSFPYFFISGKLNNKLSLLFISLPGYVNKLLYWFLCPFFFLYAISYFKKVIEHQAREVFNIQEQDYIFIPILIANRKGQFMKSGI